MRKLRFSIRTLLAITFVAAIIIVATRDRRETRYYEDARDWPQIVLSTIEKLHQFDSDTSIEQFGSKLHDLKLSETPTPEHWKDFEFYWAVDRNNKKPHYIIAGGFWFDKNKELKLVHATMNEVAHPSGGWKTIWSIKYGETTTPSPYLRMKIKTVESPPNLPGR